MFTGLVQATASVIALDRRGDDARLRLASAGLDTAGVSVGDSIAVSGVCLTVVDTHGEQLRVDVSGETLARSTLGRLGAGDEVNLEPALRLASKLGGHLVSGHVDAVGEVVGRDAAGESRQLTVIAPPGLAKYIAEKGSICVDGVSLTVNRVSGARFEVNIIPHTLEVTTLKDCVAGTRVNLEVDLIARYLERLLLGERAADAGHQGITRELLARTGFIDDR